MPSGVLAEGIDGVIPLSLFRDFLIRLDLPAKTLTLMPYPDRQALQSGGFSSATLSGDMLFLRGAVNDALEGFILLDTGASYSAVSQGAAKVLRRPLASVIALRGANGDLNGDLFAGGVRFGVSGLNFMADPVVAVDLAAFCAFHRAETLGVLGYPALRSSVLTVSYRDALVRIDTPTNPKSARVLMADERRADTR